MEKVRILYIGPLPPEVGGSKSGGVATHAWQLSKQAVINGYQVFFLNNEVESCLFEGVQIVSSIPKMTIPSYFRIARAFFGILVFSYKELKESYSNFGFSLLKYACAMDLVLHKINPDIIHIHSLHNIYCASAGIVAKKIPIVVTDHGFWQGLSKDKERRLNRIRRNVDLASLIVCVSAFSEAQLAAFNIGGKTKKTIIFNPASAPQSSLMEDSQLRAKYGTKGQKTVLFVAGCESYKRKGLGVLLEAFKDASLIKECKLMIVCESDSVGAALQFIRDNNINGSVLPLQKFNIIEELYSLADCFVMPSRSEAFSLVYIEALIRGVPLIGFYQSILELRDIIPGYIGESFNTENEGARELAEKIKFLLCKKVDRVLLMRRVRERLSWDASFKYFDKHYKDLLELKT